DRRNPLGADEDGLFGIGRRGLPKCPPSFQKPPSRKKPPEDVFTIEEIGLWLAACQRATVPRAIPGVTPAAFWTSLVTWSYNVGTRITTTLSITWDMMVAADKLRVGPPIIKGANVQEFYVNELAQRAVRTIRRADPRLFPWPHGVTYLHRVRRALLEDAGIPPERQFGFHGLRKCLCTELMAINPMVAQKMMGHLGIAMSRDCYTSTRIVKRAMKKLPQPKRPDPQMRLF
ncbi:unnamed protein product, partial [marine sediment metagenome]